MGAKAEDKGKAVGRVEVEVDAKEDEEEEQKGVKEEDEEQSQFLDSVHAGALLMMPAAWMDARTAPHDTHNTLML